MGTRNLFVYGLIFLGLACQTTAKKEESQTAIPPTWADQMQNMATDVKHLLPYLYDRSAFQSPANHDRILKYLKEFAQTAKHVNPDMGKKVLGDDLLVESSLSNLTEDLNRAARSFSLGQKDYARSVAKSSLNYCFQCHSVTQEGASAAWDLDQLQSVNLAPIEKVDLLVATRKYDKALKQMEDLLNSQEFRKNYSFDFEAMLRRYLALVIRVEKNPMRAIQELDKISRDGEVPRYIFEQLEGWKTSLVDWSKEIKRPIKTPKAMFERAEKRFRRAGEIQRYEKDHAGDVEYLRATEILHQGLKMLKSPAEQARALFLLGRAYEVLDELGSWNLHENYYEACIHRDPKSTLAQGCFNRLEASLYLGYSGSSGTHLPPEERERLKRLHDQIQVR
jgi:hypothetical protein